MNTITLSLYDVKSLAYITQHLYILLTNNNVTNQQYIMFHNFCACPSFGISRVIHIEPAQSTLQTVYRALRGPPSRKLMPLNKDVTSTFDQALGMTDDPSGCTVYYLIIREQNSSGSIGRKR